MPLVLTQTQRDCLHACLAQILAIDPRLKIAAVTTVDEMSHLPFYDQPAGYISEMIRRTERDDRSPPLACALLNQRPLDPDAQQISQQILCLHDLYKAPPPPPNGGAPIDPFAPIVMRRGQPLVGRSAAGKALRRLFAADDKVVYVVGGSPRSGRSYTMEIANYAATQMERSGKALNIALVEFNDECLDRYWTVGFIARSLADFFDRHAAKRDPRAVEQSLPVMADQGVKWLHEVARWLVDIASTGEPWWLIIDRVSCPTAPRTSPDVAEADPVDAFIQILARKISRLSSSNQLRLVVLGYDRDFPLEIAPAIVWERLPPPAPVDRREIEEFFRRFFAERGGADEATISASADEVMSNLAAAPAGSDVLVNLHASVREIVDAVAV